MITLSKSRMRAFMPHRSGLTVRKSTQIHFYSFFALLSRFVASIICTSRTFMSTSASLVIW